MRVLISAIAVISSVFLTISLATTVQAHRKDNDQKVKWERIVGFTPRASALGSPTVVGGISSVGAPWVATRGRAKINFRNDRVTFEVKGLVLTAQPPPDGVIGAPNPSVTTVKGTLVCDSRGTPSIFDTPPVPLSAQGDAEFHGTFDVSPPAGCLTPAFLIRAVTGPLADQWIAHGAVRTP